MLKSLIYLILTLTAIMIVFYSGYSIGANSPCSDVEQLDIKPLFKGGGI